MLRLRPPEGLPLHDLPKPKIRSSGGNGPARLIRLPEARLSSRSEAVAGVSFPGLGRLSPAFLLAGLPVELVDRLRSDRVLYFPALPGRAGSKPGRRPRHGTEFRLVSPATWTDPAGTTVTQTARYGTAPSWNAAVPENTTTAAPCRSLKGALTGAGGPPARRP